MPGPDEEHEYYEDFCLKPDISRPFVYSDLDPAKKEIRLVRILNRGTFEDFLFTEDGLKESEEDADFRLDNERTFVIKAAIETFPLDSCPPYIALSYTWGDPSVMRPVFVPVHPEDPQEENYYVLRVTENLFQGLRQLKPLQGLDYIWADAICINQSNGDEKNWQVAQMWDIYKTAKAVMIWLGSGGAHSNNLMDAISTSMQSEVERLLSSGAERAKLDDLRLPATFDQLSEFQSLAEKPYWNRAWVRQEISSQEPGGILVSYGRRFIPFRALHYLVCALKNSARLIRQTGKPCTSAFDDAVAAIAESHDFKSVSDTLDASSAVVGRARLVHILFTWLRRIFLWGDGLRATDPRDLIFSLLSMTTWREQDGPRLRLDYTKSCRQVYIDLVKDHPKLCIWRNDPNDTTGDDLDLPSWVPDWRRRIRPVHYVSLPLCEGNSELQYNAGNMLKYEGGYEIKPTRYSESGPDEKPQRSFVHMEGFVVDRIDRTGQTMRRNESTPTRETCKYWLARMNSLLEGRPSPIEQLTQGVQELSLTAVVQARQAAMSQASRWKLPIMNLGIVEASLATAPASYEDAFKALSEGEQAVQSVPAGEELTTNIGSYVDVMLAACTGKKFFVSTRGLLGLAFPSVELGDLIVVFPGLDVPLILRGTKIHGYRIISDAYVQGLMEAETKVDVNSNGFKLEEFAIA